MQNISLRTERLALDPPCANDVAAIVDACQDPEIPRWTGSVPSDYDEERALEFIEGVVAPGWQSGRELTWAFHLIEEGGSPAEGSLTTVPRDAADQAPGDENVGLFGGLVALRRENEKVASMGVWTAAGARRQGYTREACRAVLDFALRPPRPDDVEDQPSGLGAGRVEWRAMVGNIPSVRLAQSLGFSYEGRLSRALYTADQRLLDVWVGSVTDVESRNPLPWPAG